MYAKSTKGPILFVRHGITEYNKALNTLSINEVQTSEKYIDCSLAEEGMSQALELSLRVNDIKLKYVFCSPLNRCLETTYLGLKNHPQKDEITVIVQPLISEVIHGAQDLPKDIAEKKKLYNEKSDLKFDWSYFEAFCPTNENQDNYFLNFIDNKSEVMELLKNIEIECKEGMLGELLSHFITKNQRPESLMHLFNRNKKFKEFLNKFIIDKNYNADQGNILVITHSAFIRMASSALGYSMERMDNYPSDCYRCDNCEIVTINL